MVICQKGQPNGTGKSTQCSTTPVLTLLINKYAFNLTYDMTIMLLQLK